ncbi:MAG: site-2 protease family protein [Anaerolineae bacterium]|nr:site-2 protease family protein [Phycisphaerae bacterium]
MSSILGYILLALGFGFVIFWHELGHFLAAKWAGVKVEQFAVGFGTAAVAWRKGLGFRLRGTRTEYERRCREYLLAQEAGNATTPELADSTTDDQKLDTAGRALGLGETEYRLNWLPLGGYVKMLGQDDMNPNAVVNDPRAYNTQTISKRMVIVSAGVIMNIILAAMLFFVLFMIGFDVPPSVVGSVQPGSPAQTAGVQVGDRIVKLNGDEQLDFTKIWLSVALLPDDKPVPLELQRADSTNKETLTIHAARSAADTRGILVLGISPSRELKGVNPKLLASDEQFDPKFDPISFAQVGPDEVITQVEDHAIDNPHTTYHLLDRALQRADGKPVKITVRKTDGQTKTEYIHPAFAPPFSGNDVDFFGMVPRAKVFQLTRKSVVKDKLLPGDVITSITVLGPNDSIENPGEHVLREKLNLAGQEGNKVEVTVLRGDKLIKLPEAIVPDLSVSGGKKGFGILLDLDLAHAVVGSFRDDSSAKQAGVPRGATIVSIDGQPVKDWTDLQRIGRTLAPNKPVAVVVNTLDSHAPQTYQLSPGPAEIARIASYRYTHMLRLQERIDPRRTSNPLIAAQWGVRETRDLIIQFYITLKRMTQGSIPLSNAMGPVGIVQAGARLADRGNDWLIWFLAQISANLAVVNFLPIPIVDGGLFLFLIIEKLQGKPLSSRTQSIAQVVGLALIVSVFIFVTYQDIVR